MAETRVITAVKRKHEEVDDEKDWSSLPDETWENILRFGVESNEKDFLRFRLVNKRFKRIIGNELRFHPPPIRNVFLALWSPVPITAFNERAMKLKIKPMRGRIAQRPKIFKNLEVLHITAEKKTILSFGSSWILYFPNLTVLHLSNLHIDSFKFLPTLTYLREINFELVDVKNRLVYVTLPPKVERVTLKRNFMVFAIDYELPESLTEFVFHSTKDVILNTPNFSRCSKLTRLELTNLEVDFAKLNNCTSLEILSVSYDETLETVRNLSTALPLKELTLVGGYIPDLSGIDRFNLEVLVIRVICGFQPDVDCVLCFKSMLRKVIFHNFRIEDTYDLLSCENLEYFCANYSITDLHCILPACKSLKTLEIGGYQKVDVSCISKFEKLVTVDISVNNAVELLIDANYEQVSLTIPKSVKYLSLKEAELFDFFECVDLEVLDLHYSNCYSFGRWIDKFSKLKELYLICNTHIIHALDFSVFPKSVETLQISGLTSRCIFHGLEELINVRQLYLFEFDGVRFESKEYDDFLSKIAERAKT